MRKICILAIMLITNFCVNYFTGDNQNNLNNMIQEQNTELVVENFIDTEEMENDIQEENIVEDEIGAERVENEVIQEKVSDNVKRESVTQNNSPSKNIETSIITPSQDIPSIDHSQNVNTQEIVPVNQNVSDLPVENPIPVQKTPTPSDLEYWCVEGGSHHVLGDGANEHGYYSTWDEAYSAFESYTNGWQSVQFKVNQCACGLYYFWAIQ